MSDQENMPGQEAPNVVAQASVATGSAQKKSNKTPRVFVLIVVAVVILLAAYFAYAYVSQQNRIEASLAEEEAAMAVMLTGRIYDFEDGLMQLEVVTEDGEFKIISIRTDENTSVSEVETIDTSIRKAIEFEDLIIDNLISVISDSDVDAKTQIYAKEIVRIQ